MTQEDQSPLPNTPDGLSHSAPLMSDPDESSDATEAESTTTSSTISPPSRRTPVDLEALSPRSQAIKTLLADEMSDGYNLTTLAAELGLSPSSASALLAELRSEIELQSGPLLPLTEEEFASLKDSIQQDGVRVPVLIGEHMLIDGRHRWRACVELGLSDIPTIFVRGLTAEQERDAAVSVNAIRRHLNREQKQALIRSELQRDWSRSSRSIAAICGVTAPTVEAIREKMRKESEAEPSREQVEAVRADVERVTFVPPTREQERRVTASGAHQQAYVEQRRPPETAQERSLGYVICAHGQRHSLFRDGEGYRIEGMQ